jgi:hypothetical protein
MVLDLAVAVVVVRAVPVSHVVQQATHLQVVLE